MSDPPRVSRAHTRINKIPVSDLFKIQMFGRISKTSANQHYSNSVIRAGLFPLALPVLA
jgi:hypothetical protein